MKSKTWLALLAALAAIALAVVVIGFGGDHNSGSKTSGSGNATDAAFIADMTAHHQGAIDIAKPAREQADHTEIGTLADAIVSAQQPEIATMKAVRDDLRAMGMHDGGHMGMSQHSMGMDMDMRALENARPFDKAFIAAMVRHHKGAAAMAKELLLKGEQPALRKMAEDIISAQSEEIARMKQWRKAWYGSANVPTDMSGHGSMDDMDGGR